jgi:hypothetical protein
MHIYPFWVRSKLFCQSIAIIFILASCQTNKTAAPLPTAEVFDLYYSPSLGYLREKISACISSLGSIAPYLHEQSTEPATLLPGGVFLSLGEAELDMDDYFVTQVGRENIVFIINAANTVENIHKSDLEDIFSGRETKWDLGSDKGGQITIWVYPKGSYLTKWFSGSFLIRDSTTSVSNLAPHPQAVLESVSKDTGAIGYLPESWMATVDQQITDNIRILRFDESIELSLPVLAYLTDKPEGGVKDLIFCLQEK